MLEYKSLAGGVEAMHKNHFPYLPEKNMAIAYLIIKFFPKVTLKIMSLLFLETLVMIGSRRCFVMATSIALSDLPALTISNIDLQLGLLMGNTGAYTI